GVEPRRLRQLVPYAHRPQHHALAGVQLRVPPPPAPLPGRRLRAAGLTLERWRGNVRKIISITQVTLDGVMQAPGGPEEDPSNGFKYGGWTAPYSDDNGGEFFQKNMRPAEYLLGRKTFEIFAGYWPKHADTWPGINDGMKYVLS